MPDDSTKDGGGPYPWTMPLPWSEGGCGGGPEAPEDGVPGGHGPCPWRVPLPWGQAGCGRSPNGGLQSTIANTTEGKVAG